MSKKIQNFPENGYEILSHGGIGNEKAGYNLTASCHELRIFIDGKIHRILIDMGGYQGPGNIERSMENILGNNNETGESVSQIVITHGHMDHIGDLLHATKNSANTIIANAETKKIIEIALTDAIKIAETDYERKKHNFESYIKNVLSPAVKIVQEYKNGGIKRNNKGSRMKTTHEEHNRKEIFENAKKILDKENINAHNKNWRHELNQPKKPEFSLGDLENLLQKITIHNLQDGWHEIIPGKVSMCYFNAGHVLGSASPLFRIIDEKNQEHYVHFSGDIGSFKGGISPSGLPTPPTEFPIETLIIESTYGGKTRESFEKNLQEYESDFKKDIKKYNRIIQACFSLDRLQKILYYTIDMKKRGIIPNNIPIFVDSKMGAQYIDPYIKSAAGQIKEKENPQIPHQMHTQTKNLKKFIDYLNPNNKEYEVLNLENRDMILESLDGKAIIITASGMADGGPIMEYLKRYGSDEKSVFYFPGFLVPGTTGHNIANRENQKKIAHIDGQEIEIKAKMSQKQGFSAHGDEKDLLQYIQRLRLALDSHILIVHGDRESSSLALSHTLKRKGVPQNIIIPDIGNIFQKNFSKQ